MLFMRVLRSKAVSAKKLYTVFIPDTFSKMEQSEQCERERCTESRLEM